MNRHSDTFDSSIPHMSSIWLDEDEETEKLYNLQSEKFLRDDSEEESLQVYLLNSDSVDEVIRTVPVTPQSGSVEQFAPQRPAPSPLLENMLASPERPASILSAARTPSRHSSLSSSEKPQTSLRKKLLLRLKKKWGGNKLRPLHSQKEQQNQISAPFHFQHIFHADVGAALGDPAAMGTVASVADSDSDAGNLTEDSSEFYKEDSFDMSEGRRGSTNTLILSKAFCTEEIKSSEFDRSNYRKGRNSTATYTSYEVEECMKRRSSAFYL